MGSAETAKEKYGDDIHKRWGKSGGKAKVRKGLPVYLEKLTPEERAEWYAERSKKRWGDKNAGKKMEGTEGKSQ